jgi:hypothetical protein
MARRRHGGRRARVRGRAKIAADFALLAAAVNLARLARLGLTTGNRTVDRGQHLSGRIEHRPAHSAARRR